MKLRVSQLREAIRSVIREVAGDFADQADFEQQLAAAKEEARSARQSANYAEGETYYKEMAAVQKLDARVHEMEEQGREMGFLPAKPVPAGPGPATKKVSADRAASSWLRLVKQNPSRNLASAWDDMVAAAPEGLAGADKIAADHGISKPSITFHMRMLKNGSSVTSDDLRAAAAGK